MFDAAASRDKVPGNNALRLTVWPPSVLKEFAKVAKDLPPVGGKGPGPFAPLRGINVPLVVLHQIATAPPPLQTPTGAVICMVAHLYHINDLLELPNIAAYAYQDVHV